MNDDEADRSVFKPRYNIDAWKSAENPIIRKLSIYRGHWPSWLSRLQFFLLNTLLKARYWISRGNLRQRLLDEFCTEQVLTCYCAEDRLIVEFPDRFHAPIWKQIIQSGRMGTYLTAVEAQSGFLAFEDSPKIIKGSLTLALRSRFEDQPVRLSAVEWMNSVIDVGSKLVEWPPISPYDYRERQDRGRNYVEQLARPDRTFPARTFGLS